jgi:CDP-diacylglycerol--glycerol-3-phosphate 3-phosphatidyltransferase
MILPNQLTVARIILTPVFLFFFLLEDPLYKQISIVIYIIAAITDWYDGWLARKFNYITEWGEFLDPLADKILTSTVFIAFAIMGILEFWMVILIIVRDFLITALRLYAELKKRTFATSKSAKWKTFMQMAFLYYLLLIEAVKTFESFYKENFEIVSIFSNPTLIYFLMLAITFFTVYTGITYIFKNRLLIRKLFSSENRNN